MAARYNVRLKSVNKDSQSKIVFTSRRLDRAVRHWQWIVMTQDRHSVVEHNGVIVKRLRIMGK